MQPAPSRARARFGFATGASGGNHILQQVAIPDDGVIYSADLTIGTNYRLYRWQNWTDTAVTAFTGDPANGTAPPGQRVGDSLAVTGAGINTRLLAGVLGNGANNTSNVVLFTTGDGTNFSPTLVEISGLPAVNGGAQFGLAFRTNRRCVAEVFATNRTADRQSCGLACYDLQGQRDNS